LQIKTLLENCLQNENFDDATIVFHFPELNYSTVNSAIFNFPINESFSHSTTPFQNLSPGIQLHKNVCHRRTQKLDGERERA
jgi:hypothetical protein